MGSNDTILRRDEEYVLALRRLYESYGYKKFKMSKFEKYDLYLENKSFLKNGSIITVTDPKGRLLALKPDITLSIVKNIRVSDLPEKVYYNENVYIADGNSGEIKETTQVGLEYFGDLDVRALAEVLLLAAESLSNADEKYRIAISHMGIISEILDNANLDESGKSKVLKLISEKNLHGLKMLCENLSVDDESTKRICALVSLCGELGKVIEYASELVCGEISKSSYDELFALSEIIASFGLSQKFILDFSVMNDMNYYNGLVFQGFINGVPKNVLSGGRYDNLVKRFGVETGAIGFAVYIDLLDAFNYRVKEFDYDVLLVYSEDCDPIKVLSAEREIVASGKRCIALNTEITDLKYRFKAYLDKEGVLKYE